MKKVFTGDYMGTGSTGPAVLLLQLMLKARGSDRLNPIALDGKYDYRTRAAVKRLQCALRFRKDDQHGHFCPRTREAFAKFFGVDVGKLTVDMFQGESLCLDQE